MTCSQIAAHLLRCPAAHLRYTGLSLLHLLAHSSLFMLDKMLPTSDLSPSQSIPALAGSPKVRCLSPCPSGRSCISTAGTRCVRWDHGGKQAGAQMGAQTCTKALSTRTQLHMSRQKKDHHKLQLKCLGSNKILFWRPY